MNNEEYFLRVELLGIVSEDPGIGHLADSREALVLKVEIPEFRTSFLAKAKFETRLNVIVTARMMDVGDEDAALIIKGSKVRVIGELVHDAYGFPIFHRTPNGNIENYFHIRADEIYVIR